MDETSSIVATLKTVLRSKSITYADVAAHIGISEASVKRNFAEASFTLARLQAICAVAGLSISELTALNRAGGGTDHHVYTLAQERFFADNLEYLAFFDLLIRFGTVAKVVEYRPTLTDQAIATYLRQLEKMGLVERLPGDKVRFPVTRHVSWLKDGPLRRKLLPLAKNDFVQGDFSGPTGCFEFSGIEMTESSARQVLAKMQELAQEIRYIGDLESKIDAETRNYGFLLGQRQWKLTVLEEC